MSMTLARTCIVLFVVLLTAGSLNAGAPTAGHCINETYDLSLPKRLDESKLKDGEHMLAALLSDRGLFEARATVKKGKLGEMAIYLGGTALKDVPSQEIPASSLQCLKKEHTELEDDDQGGTFFGTLSDWLIPAAHAAMNCKGTGTITIKLFDCWQTAGGQRCAYQYLQRGKVCGWAILGPNPQ